MLHMCNAWFVRGHRRGGEKRETGTATPARNRARQQASATATAATATATAARPAWLALRRVLALTRLRRGRPVRIGRLTATAIGAEAADVFPQRCLVQIQHVAPAPAPCPGRIGTHKQQQETVTKSGTHLGSAIAPGPKVGPVGTRRGRHRWVACAPYASRMTVPGRSNERRPKRC